MFDWVLNMSLIPSPTPDYFLRENNTNLSILLNVQIIHYHSYNKKIK